MGQRSTVILRIRSLVSDDASTCKEWAQASGLLLCLLSVQTETNIDRVAYTVLMDQLMLLDYTRMPKELDRIVPRVETYALLSQGGVYIRLKPC